MAPWSGMGEPGNTRGGLCADKPGMRPLDDKSERGALTTICHLNLIPRARQGIPERRYTDNGSRTKLKLVPGSSAASHLEPSSSKASAPHNDLAARSAAHPPWSTLPTTAVSISTLSCAHRVENSPPHPAAGSLVWFDPDTQENVVYNLGDIAWVLASTALVWIMIPGVGFFYSGLLRRKNALSMIWLSMMVLAVVSFQVSRCCLLSSRTTKRLIVVGVVVLLGFLTSIQ